MDVRELGLRPAQQEFVDRFMKACIEDERVVAAFLGGSYVKGKADEYSDVDLCLITTEAAHEDVYRQREAFLQQLGELVFLEDFGIPDIAFFIFAHGVEGELNFGSEDHLDKIHSGPFHVLLDKKKLLTRVDFSEPGADPSEQAEKLRLNISGFWHELSHFTTAIGRGQLWWAGGQLEALRSICVNLARLQNHFSNHEAGDEPYFKIENAMPVDKLEALKATFCPLEKSAMLASAHIILQFYAGTATSLAQTHGIPYPLKLEKVMRERLEKLL